jgi:hypothetical protein
MSPTRDELKMVLDSNTRIAIGKLVFDYPMALSSRQNSYPLTASDEWRPAKLLVIIDNIKAPL